MKKSAIASLTVGSGLAFAYLITTVARPGSIPNYAVTNGLNELGGFVITIALGFFFGAFVGANIPWLFSKAEKSHSPFLVTGGMIAGAFIGFVATTFLLSMTYRMLHDSRFFPFFRQVLGWLMPLTLAYLGAYLAAGIERKSPKSLLRRIARTSLGLLIFAGLFNASIRGCGRLPGILARNDFPAAGSMEVRHHWALNKFMDYYPKAVDLVKSSEAIQNDAGKISAIAPAVNASNYFTKAPGDPGVAVFTLDVEGNKGKGICRISLSRNNGDVVNGERTIGISNFDWEFGDKEIPLTKDGRIDQFRYEIDQKIQRRKKESAGKTLS